MPTRHPLTISLTPELADLVATKVASGFYGSASEVIRAGLRLLAEQQAPVLAGGRNPASTRPKRAGQRAQRGAAKHG